MDSDRLGVRAGLFSKSPQPPLVLAATLVRDGKVCACVCVCVRARGEVCARGGAGEGEMGDSCVCVCKRE